MDFAKWPAGEIERIDFSIIANACGCKRSVVIAFWLYMLEYGLKQNQNGFHPDIPAYLCGCGSVMITRISNKMQEMGLITASGTVVDRERYYDSEQSENQEDNTTQENTSTEEPAPSENQDNQEDQENQDNQENQGE